MGNNEEEEEEAKISPPSAQPSPAAEKPVAQGAAHNSRTIASQSTLRTSLSNQTVFCYKQVK